MVPSHCPSPDRHRSTPKVRPFPMVSVARAPGSPDHRRVPGRRTALLAGLALAGGCALAGGYRLAEAGGGSRRGPLPIAAGAVDGVYYDYGRRLAYWIGHGLTGVHVSVDV